VIADDDLAVGQFIQVKSRNMIWSAMIGGEAEHLVKIAVIHAPVPGDGKSCFAHHLVKNGRIESINQGGHVVAVIICLPQVLEIPTNRHIGDAEEMIKDNGMVVLERMPIRSLQRGLRTRQIGAAGVVDQVQDKTGADVSIASGIEPVDGLNQFREDSLSSSAVIGFQLLLIQ
jgi:hypothetical protein